MPTQTKHYLPPISMPTNTTSVIFTPGLKVGFFGPNGSFHLGIMAGLATLPQVSRILYVYFILLDFDSRTYRTAENYLTLL
jgi:hypothetical protein